SLAVSEKLRPFLLIRRVRFSRRNVPTHKQPPAQASHRSCFSRRTIPSKRWGPSGMSFDEFLPCCTILPTSDLLASFRGHKLEQEHRDASKIVRSMEQVQNCHNGMSIENVPRLDS